MEVLIAFLTGVFGWLVVNHPLKDWEIDFEDKYDYYLKQFEKEIKKKRDGD